MAERYDFSPTMPCTALLVAGAGLRTLRLQDNQGVTDAVMPTVAKLMP